MKKHSYASEQQPVRPVSDQTAEAEQTRDTAFGKAECVASATECTGLSPAAVRDEPEAQAYAQLYGVHTQLPEKGRNVTAQQPKKH